MVNGYRPSSLKAALEIRAREPVVPYAGGTDLMVKPEEDSKYLFINKLHELKNIVVDEEYIRIGAACTFTEVIENGFIPMILKESAKEVAAPAIRNLGTVGGNICNGSPKGDSTLIFFATDSKLRLASSSGERIIDIAEFLTGRNRTALRKDELLVEILMKKSGLENYYYKKVGARNALAISRVAFAAVLEMEDCRILNCMTAFGGIGDTIIRRKDIDSMFAGKTVEEARGIKDAYLAAYDKEIVPIKGRVSAEYRKAVCMNLLRDFLESNGI